MALVGGAVTASTYLAQDRIAAQAIRYVGTALVLVATARFRGRVDPRWRLRRPVAQEWMWLFAAATCGLTVYNLALVEALQHADTAMVASIVAGVPLALALAAPLLAGRRVERRILTGATVIVAGSLLVYGAGRSDATGVVLSATALACECAFTLLGAPVLARLGAASIATHTAWIAAVQLSLMVVLSSGFSLGSGWDRPALLSIGYLIAASAIAFVLWFDAVDRIGSAVCGLAAGAIPIAALATGLVSGAAHVDPVSLVGVVVVVAGIVAALRGPTTATAVEL